MQTIIFTAFKGGAGKSTALMAAASCLLERGHKIALIEGDDNQPLIKWRDYARSNKTWDESCAIYQSHDIEAYEKAVVHAEKEGVEFLLVDTRGGGSDLNQAFILNANLIVIPTGLSIIEVDETLATLEYVYDFMRKMDVDVPAGVLVNRIPPAGKLPSMHAEGLKTLSEMPVFEVRLPKRQLFEDIKALGMIHRYHRRLMAMPSKRVTATHSSIALKEAEAMTAEFLETLAEPTEPA